MNIGIVGAGVSGLVSAYELAKNKCKVTVFETLSEPGGLTGTIKIGNEHIEKYYHHIFISDVEVTNLIEELGLASKLKWVSPKSGIFINNKLYPLSTPIDLLKFKEISLTGRLLLGISILRARFIKNWRSLENINAKDWVIKNSGKSVYDKLWGPLLNSKFDESADNVSSVWLWNKFKLRGSSRGDSSGREVFGYLEGSFMVIYQKLIEEIKRMGGEIHYSSTVRKIVPKKDKSLDVITDNNTQNFDRVITTCAPEIFNSFNSALPSDYSLKLNKIKYKANICAIFELSRKLSNYYWITVAQKDNPFVLIAEHTNLVSPEPYGSHLIYLSRYIDKNNELYSLPDKEIFEIFLKSLIKMFPDLKREEIKDYHIHKADFAQPVVVKNYSTIKPDIKTPVDNLYMINMSQIYPQDRGQNYAIKLGREAAGIINKSN